MNKSSNWARKLQAIGACGEAVEWAADQPNFPTAWQDCERADWLLWLAGQMADKKGWPSRKEVILAGIACGRLSLEYAGKYRAQLAEVFDIAERCANDPSPENVSAARSAAWSAANAAAWSAARSAARSAANAARSARSAANAAAWSAESAWSAANAARSAESAESAESAARSARSAANAAAWSAARSAARSAAWSAAHKTMCGIIRERITPGEL